MRVNIDIDYGRNSKKIEFTEEADEYRFPADPDVRELFEAERLLTNVYEKAIAALGAMKQRAIAESGKTNYQGTDKNAE